MNLKPKTILAGMAGGYVGGFASSLKQASHIPMADHLLPAGGGAAAGYFVGGRRVEDALIGGVAGWALFHGAKFFKLPIYPSMSSMSVRNWVPAGGTGGVYRPIS